MSALPLRGIVQTQGPSGRRRAFTESELLDGLHALVSRLEFFSEFNIPLGAWVEAYRLCRDVDENDTPYVALCLHLDARLWTADKELKASLAAKGFNRFIEA